MAHLRTALSVAWLLGLCQLVIETLVIAARARGVLLSPAFFETRIYDFCVKLFLAVPAGADWIRGGVLDRFLETGFASKLGLGIGLILPNALVMTALGLLVAALRFTLRRPARPLPALATMVAVGLAVLALDVALAVPIPKEPTAFVIARNTARVVLSQGAWFAFAVLVVAGAAAASLARARHSARHAVWLGTVTAAGLILLALVPGGLTTPVAEGSLAAAGPAFSPSTPVDNVILISVDSMRADRLGCYGNPRDTSPAMDRLSREGARFTNAMSSTSWTLPSHMSMMTGRDALSHRVISDNDQLSDSIPPLAEHLQQVGLATVGVVSAEFLLGHYGFARGFDVYDDTTVPAKTWYEALRDEKAPVVADLAGHWLRAHQSRRFFLFLHFWDVHYDYVPPAPYDTMFDPDYGGSIDGANFMQNPAINRRMPRRDLDHLIALYDGEIRWVDEHIGRILAVLDEIGLADRTAVILTADHGDEFFEHGGKGHQRTLYREVVQVPLMVRAPGVAAGRVVDQPVSLADIMPTVLDLVGAPAPAGMNGSSLAPLMTGGQPDGTSVYAWLCNPKRRTNCQAMQHSSAGTLIHFFQPPRLAFYGPTDTTQRNDLARTRQWPRAQQLQELHRHLDSRWWSYRTTAGRQSKVELNKAAEERLRALGYGDE